MNSKHQHEWVQNALWWGSMQRCIGSGLVLEQDVGNFVMLTFLHVASASQTETSMHQQIHVTQPLKLAANWNGARYFAKSILVLYIHTSANVCFLHPFCCSFVCSSECQLGTDWQKRNRQKEHHLMYWNFDGCDHPSTNAIIYNTHLTGI